MWLNLERKRASDVYVHNNKIQEYTWSLLIGPQCRLRSVYVPHVQVYRGLSLGLSKGMENSKLFDVEQGHHPATGARYELYSPLRKSKCPAVILLHGFQCKLDYHRGTAAMLAQNGIACLLVDLLPLMSLFRARLLVLRENNVQATIQYVEWINSRPDILAGEVILAGYSAGGAIALEASTFLAGQGKILSVLLLDAVPWFSTLDRGAAAKGLSAPSPIDINDVLKDGKVVVTSLRGDASSFNANGMILEQLARGIGDSETAFDVLVCSARHGDFMCSTESDEGGGVDGYMGKLMNLIGLFSSRQIRETIQELILGYCESIFRRESSYASLVDSLTVQGLIHVRTIDKSLPSMRTNVPYYLK